MAKQLVDTGAEPSAASHSAGGILVGMGDGSVRNAAPPQSPAGPVPVPYPNLEAAAGVSGKGDGGYVVTSASHVANDTTYQGDSSAGSGAFQFTTGGDSSAAYFNGFVSRFSAGTVDGGGGPHALYEDLLVPTGQISDGTSNTILFGEVVHTPGHSWDILA